VTVKDFTLQTLLNNIGNSTSIADEKKEGCKEVARMLLENGFEIAFIAGVLGNIQHEGNSGLFEYYNADADYFLKMEQYYQYRQHYSGKRIYSLSTKNLTDVYNMLVELDANSFRIDGSRAGFGLGLCQWTMDRTFALVKLYREVNSAQSSITSAQVLQGEVQMIVTELLGAYKWVYTNWKAANNSSLQSPNAAEDAAHRFCNNYEVPSDRATQAPLRGQTARLIYAEINPN
jgi:hypothetical protein